MQSTIFKADVAQQNIPALMSFDLAPRSHLATAADQLPVLNPGLFAKLAISDANIIAACNLEWEELVAPFADFAEMVESVDTSICPAADLAELIMRAPTKTVAIAIGEMAYCRRQEFLAVGCEFTAPASTVAIFEASAAAWADELSAFPVYAKWLDSIDRMSCDQATLLHAIRSAPSLPIRQAMRGMFHFRATLALTYNQTFA